MPFELEKKFIIATLLFVLLIFCFVAVFFLLNRNREPAPLMEEIEKREDSQGVEYWRPIENFNLLNHVRM